MRRPQRHRPARSIRRTARPKTGPACSATDQFAGSVYQLARSLMHFGAPGTTKRPPIRKQRIRPQHSLISTPAWFRCPRLASVSWAKTDLLHYSRALKPGQQAILVASNGLYSFKGSGYVRGGIFDRFEVIQGDTCNPLPGSHAFACRGTSSRRRARVSRGRSVSRPRGHDVGPGGTVAATAAGSTRLWRAR